MSQMDRVIELLNELGFKTDRKDKQWFSVSIPSEIRLLWNGTERSYMDIHRLSLHLLLPVLEKPLIDMPLYLKESSESNDLKVAGFLELAIVKYRLELGI